MEIRWKGHKSGKTNETKRMKRKLENMKYEKAKIVQVNEDRLLG
jgi:hypothetical protein